MCNYYTYNTQLAVNFFASDYFFATIVTVYQIYVVHCSLANNTGQLLLDQI